jgi:C1A family cysteine protease
LTGACLCGVECQQSIFKPDERNIVKYIPHGKTYGGHALAIIGYKLIDGKEHWIIRNSWGKDYGDNGNFYISFEDFRKIVMDDVYVIVDSDTKYMFEEYKRKFYSNTESSKESAIEVIKRWLENLLLRK